MGSKFTYTGSHTWIYIIHVVLYRKIHIFDISSETFDTEANINFDFDLIDLVVAALLVWPMPLKRNIMIISTKSINFLAHMSRRLK